MLNYDQIMLVGITVKRQKNLEVQFCTSKKIDSAFKQMHKVVQHLPMVIQEIDMKEITLIFNDITTKLVSDEDGYVHLNRLHEAHGGNNNFAPAQWKRNESTRKFLNVQNRTIKTKRGRYDGGTWVDEQTAYHYASWISPE